MIQLSTGNAETQSPQRAAVRLGAEGDQSNGLISSNHLIPLRLRASAFP